MQKKKQKYYVVWHGHRPGIYTTWETCQKQVKNFPNAIFKSFDSKADAEEAYASGPEKKTARASSFIKKTTSSTDHAEIIWESISVDAACSGNPGVMEYRGVWSNDKTEIFHFGPVREGTNNIGEFLAIVHALAWLQKRGDDKTPVYSDSRNAQLWVKAKKAKTTLQRNARNAALFDMIYRAEKWLMENTWKNKILKWETKSWGEIPADFGRK